MRIFQPRSLLDALSRLENDRCVFQRLKRESGGGSEVPENVLQLFQEHIERALSVCDSADLRTAHRQISLVSISIVDPRSSDGVLDASTLLTHTQTVIHAMASDLWKRSFIMVAPESAKHIDDDTFLGEDVSAAFPSARLDIRESGNCLAAECATACVFHLMRVAEWGLRSLAVDLGLLRVLRGRKRAKYVPLAWSEWESILNQLPEKVDTKIEKLRPGPRKQSMQEFYYPAIQDIKGTRDAWRNHVMHTRREYTMPEAWAIKDYVQRLMSTLATRVSET